MRLRTSVIMVVLTLFVVASSASATMPWQHKPKQSNSKADAISGAWDTVLITDDNTVQLTLTLKLEGNKVTGSFESSHLGSGAINNEVISKFKKALKHSVQVVLDEKDSDECAICFLTDFEKAIQTTKAIDPGE